MHVHQRKKKSTTGVVGLGVILHTLIKLTQLTSLIMDLVFIQALAIKNNA